MARKAAARTTVRGRKRATRPAAADADVPACALAAHEGLRAELAQEGIDRLAMEWSYVVRNRHRWAESPTEVERLSQKAVSDLARLGVNAKTLAALAACPVVEVQVDYRSEEASWAPRIFPWEFVLSRATRQFPDRHPDFLVVRHLRRDSPAKLEKRPRSLLSVASSPGIFLGEYNFEDEHALLAQGFERFPEFFRQLDNPTARELERQIPNYSAVHLSGVDAHLGAEIIARNARAPGASKVMSAEPRDGFYLAGEGGGEQLIDALPLARILTPPNKAPELVTFNVYSSAARMASLCVAGGAGAAVGFQDRFDDAQSERFFAVFYQRWSSGQPLLASFQAGFRAMRQQKSVRMGSAVVLWSATSVLEPALAQPRPKLAKRKRPSADESRAALKLRVELPKTLNYPKLHNGENLFTRLIIYNHNDDSVRNVQLEVALRVGAESYSYHHRLDLEHPVVSLEHKVRIALSWSMMRGLSESVQTTILVRASQDGKIFHEDTYSVELLPVHEWVDDENSGPWLPSLVLPRDPVVPKIIDRARRYLRVLADDAHVGFDGYQRVGLSPEDEIDEEQVWIVDVQVRAIWYALLHDYGLGYINPPPTFTAQSQRLRRPSDVVEGRHGTCIDLALLFAACLEYVGINPVLFLIEGHAFPGYWRMDTTLEQVDTSGQLDRKDIERMQARSRPWSSGRLYWKELDLRIQRGQIVPIETVDLTALESFDLAVEHGRENLREEAEFHTMLDVLKAREHRVTPLPL